MSGEKFDLVIAHYKESLGWIKRLNNSHIRHIYVYNKYKASSIFDYKKINPKTIINYLPNIGREAHTYLNYCLNNYDTLPEFVFFLQGNPMFHGLDEYRISYLIDKIIGDKLTHSPNYMPNTSIYFGLTSNGRREFWAGSETEASTHDVKSFIKTYISKDMNAMSLKNIYFGANFAVSKDRILSRDVSEYKRLIDNELSTINPESGHYMERLWFYWFNLT